jgi:hypothetical protein
VGPERLLREFWRISESGSAKLVGFSSDRVPIQSGRLHSTRSEQGAIFPEFVLPTVHKRACCGLLRRWLHAAFSSHES